MKLLAVVVTYYPNRLLIKQNIKSFLDCVDEIIIWENTPSNEAFKYRFLDNEKITYMSSGQNSISKALNTVWHYADSKGYDSILTMDQDSYFEDFQGYKNWAEKKISETPSICAPCYNERHEKGVLLKKHVITSGMIVPITILRNINGYCEYFAVDAIDIDLCIKARANGYLVLQNTAYCLRHHFGTPYEKNVFGHKFQGLNYPPHRLKGIFKNYIITYRQNNCPAYLKKEIHWNYANYIPNIIFCEKNKIAKLWAVISGTFCGLTFNITKSKI